MATRINPQHMSQWRRAHDVTKTVSEEHIYIYIYIYTAHMPAHIKKQGNTINICGAYGSAYPQEKSAKRHIYIYIYMRRRYRRISKKQDVDMLTWPAGDAKMLKIRGFCKQKSRV